MSVNCNSIFLNNELIIANFQGKVKNNEKTEVIWNGEYGQKIIIDDIYLENYISFYNQYIKPVSQLVVNYKLFFFAGGHYTDMD